MNSSRTNKTADSVINRQLVSLERRIFEAWMDNKGLRLTYKDVRSLVRDDAVATRISNVAAEEAGVDIPGTDCLPNRHRETWDELKARLSD